MADELRDAGNLLAGMVGRAVEAVDDTLRKVTNTARNVLTFLRVRHVNFQGNQIHSVNLWTLGIQKIYMGPLSYNVQISHFLP